MPVKLNLIGGLGNPGPSYQNTYHNLGFLTVDELAKRAVVQSHAAGWRNPKTPQFEYLKSDRLIFVKNKTSMNESGRAVKTALEYFRVKPENAVIVHDDSDIELGQYKFSFGRGAAGHRGVQSGIDFLKTKNFWRARIGLRKPRSKKKAGEMVLSKVSRADSKIFQKTLMEVSKTLLKQNG